MGTAVEFPRSALVGSRYDSGDSVMVQDAWDTLLFHGVGADAATRFEASRETSSGWTPWAAAELRRRGKNGRFWGRAAFPHAGPGALRLRAAAPPGSRGGAARILGVEVFDSRDLESAGGLKQSAAAPPAIALIDRAAWQAQPPKLGYQPHVPVAFTLHHTDGLQTSTRADSEEEVRFIQDLHMNGRGWNDIGYHFLVDAAGNIFEGRPEDVVGAHTQDHNTGNIGIALLGTYDPPQNDALTPTQERAVVAIGHYLIAKYKIDPASLKGHRDYRPTRCPGDVAYAKLDELRRLFAQAPAQPLAATGAAH